MVKFGKYLESHQIPEWSSQYVRYKRLKKVLKQIRLQAEARFAAEEEEHEREHNAEAEHKDAQEEAAAATKAQQAQMLRKRALKNGAPNGRSNGEGDEMPDLEMGAAPTATDELRTGAAWIARSRAEVAARERIIAQQKEAAANSAMSRRLSLVHIQPQAHADPTEVDMAAINKGTPEDMLPPPPPAPPGVHLEKDAPSNAIRFGSLTQRTGRYDFTEAELQRDEPDDQRSLDYALQEGKRHETDALLVEEDRNFRRLTSYIPAEVSATFLQGEHDFFQLLEEDLNTCNYFFLKQEEFFLDKINVIVEQLDRLIHEERMAKQRKEAQRRGVSVDDGSGGKSPGSPSAASMGASPRSSDDTAVNYSRQNGANGQQHPPQQSPLGDPMSEEDRVRLEELIAAVPVRGGGAFSPVPSPKPWFQPEYPDIDSHTSPVVRPHLPVQNRLHQQQLEQQRQLLQQQQRALSPLAPNGYFTGRASPSSMSRALSASPPLSPPQQLNGDAAAASLPPATSSSTARLPLPPPPPSLPPAVPAPPASRALAAANFVANLEPPRPVLNPGAAPIPPTVPSPRPSLIGNDEIQRGFPADAAAPAATDAAMPPTYSSDSLLHATRFPGAEVQLGPSRNSFSALQESDEDAQDHDGANQNGESASSAASLPVRRRSSNSPTARTEQAPVGSSDTRSPNGVSPPSEGGSQQQQPQSPSPPQRSGTTPAAPSLAQRMHMNLKFRLMTAQKPWRVLEKALTELYRGLHLLRNYKILNFTAFVKILKKYDRVVGRELGLHKDWAASATLLPRIQSTHFLASPILKAFLRRVELIFAQTFTKGDHKAALEGLRSVAPPLSRWDLFRLGLLCGVSGILLITLIIVSVWIGVVANDDVGAHFTANLPVWRSLALIILHLIGWGACVYFFQKYRVNHEFIFEINPKTELRFEQVLLLAATLTSIWFVLLVLFLFVSIAAEGGQWSNAGDALGALVCLAFVGMMALAICPFDILFRPTRWYILRTIGRIIAAPFYPIDFKDF